MRSTIRCTAPTAGRTGTDVQGSRADDPAHALDDDDLRRALIALGPRPHWPGTPQWEAIGHQLLALAERDSHDWPGHPEEYQGAYLDAAVTLLRRNPAAVIAAARPWGMLVAQAQTAARAAVANEVAVGLTDRDPINHRARVRDLPGVTSWERLVGSADTSTESW